MFYHEKKFLITLIIFGILILVIFLGLWLGNGVQYDKDYHKISNSHSGNEEKKSTTTKPNFDFDKKKVSFDPNNNNLSSREKRQLVQRRVEMSLEQDLNVIYEKWSKVPDSDEFAEIYAKEVGNLIKRNVIKEYEYVYNRKFDEKVDIHFNPNELEGFYPLYVLGAG